MLKGPVLIDSEMIRNCQTLENDLKAPPRLRDHHALVFQTYVDFISIWNQRFKDYPLHGLIDINRVAFAIYLHDIGKVIHPAELEKEGSLHEQAGYELLRQHAVPDTIARLVFTTGAEHSDSLERVIVSLCDCLWKGTRIEGLENKAVSLVSKTIQSDYWEVFMRMDNVFEKVAAKGERRIAKFKQDHEI